MDLKVGNEYRVKLDYDGGNPELIKLFKMHTVTVKVLSLEEDGEVARVTWVQIPKAIANFYDYPDEDEEQEGVVGLQIECFSWKIIRKEMNNK